MDHKLTSKLLGLRPDCLSFPEVLSQSVANVTPSVAPALMVPLVFAVAGKGTTLAFLIATIGLGLVCLNINQFARRSATPASMYSFIARGFGSTIGILSGWSLILAYLFTAAALMGCVVNYVDVIFHVFQVHIPAILVYAFGIGIAGYIAYRDIQLSTIFMLVLELFSVGLILILAVIVLVEHGITIDTSQIFLQGVSFNGIQQGLVLAFFGYVGFESATTLGDEAKKPLKNIPRAVMWSTLYSGCFFMVLSYTEILGFRGYEIPLDKSNAPLNVLATLAGVKFFGAIISTATIMSGFGGTLASIHAGSRVLFALARHGIFPSAIGRAHNIYRTPYIAVLLLSIVSFMIDAAISFLHVAPIDVYGYLASIATYGFLEVYVLVCAAAPFYLHPQGKLSVNSVLISISAIIFMLIPLFGSFYPVPPPPYNILPYIFLTLLLVGGGGIFMTRLRYKKIIENIDRDLEAIQNKFISTKII